MKKTILQQQMKKINFMVIKLILLARKTIAKTEINNNIQH